MSLQAIVTKYIGPTGVRQSRVKASALAGSVTIKWQDDLNPEDNHKAAAMELVAKFDWRHGRWIAGGLPDGGMVWCCDANGVESFRR